MELEGKGAKASEKIETARLLLRRPKQSDAQAVFHRYASDRDVTRYLSWPTHRSVADTLAFIALSDEEWRRWPAGPYLVLTRENGRAQELVGSTGLFYKSATRAVTGYSSRVTPGDRATPPKPSKRWSKWPARRPSSALKLFATPNTHRQRTCLKSAASSAKKCGANTSSSQPAPPEEERCVQLRAVLLQTLLFIPLDSTRFSASERHIRRLRHPHYGLHSFAGLLLPRSTYRFDFRAVFWRVRIVDDQHLRARRSGVVWLLPCHP